MTRGFWNSGTRSTDRKIGVLLGGSKAHRVCCYFLHHMLIDKPRALLGNEVKFIPYTLVKQIVSLYCKKLAGPVCMDFGNHKTKTGENCQSDFMSHLIQRPGFK